MRSIGPAALSLACLFGTCARAGEEAQAGARAGEEAPLRLEKTIPLPGVEGRIDHLAIDTKGQRLFIAALGNNSVEVVDLAASKVVHSIRGMEEPQGILFIPGSSTIAVASGGDGSLRLYDGETFKMKATIGSRDDADNLRYDQKTRRIFLGYGKGALAFVDAAKASVTAEVKLAGHPESFQLEAKGPRIFVNVPTAGQVAVVDRDKAALVATWKIEGAEANFPMALDEARGRLLIGCRKPPRMLVLEMETGKQVGSVDSSGDADDLFLDPAAGRVYLSCGEGSIDVFRREEGDRYTRVARIPTSAGARTSLLSGDPGRLYLAVPHRGAQRTEVRIYRTGP